MKHIPSDLATLGMVATALVIAIIREVILITKGKISMDNHDCKSCKKFSRVDPFESEGYCNAKRVWVDPQEGEECKMHEFTLHSATKYKDGTPIMSEPETDVNSSYPNSALKEQSNQLDTDFCKLGKCHCYDKFCDHTLQDKHMCPYLPHDTDANVKYLEQVFTEFAKTQDELIEEYDATLKIHGDTLEQHLEHLKDMDAILATHAGKINSHTDTLEEHLDRICKLEHLYEQLISKLCSIELLHTGSNFCGNCTHVKSKDGIYTCKLNKGITDPDESSCPMFEPPF